jgi:hypothetical protein
MDVYRSGGVLDDVLLPSFTLRSSGGFRPSGSIRGAMEPFVKDGSNEIGRAADGGVAREGRTAGPLEASWSLGDIIEDRGIATGRCRTAGWRPDDTLTTPGLRSGRSRCSPPPPPAAVTAASQTDRTPLAETDIDEVLTRGPVLRLLRTVS